MEERKRFFNQPSALADYSHWCKAAHWTLEEAVALSFGKAPEKVRWETVKSLRQVSKFAFEYERRRDLASRAKIARQLTDPVLPGFFVGWAKRIGLELATGLEEAVAAQGHQLEDWKGQLDREKLAHAKTKEWASVKINETMEWGKAQHAEALKWGSEKVAEVLEQGRAAIVERNTIIAQLQHQVSELESLRLDAAQKKQPDSAKNSLLQRERESLVKLVIGMAIRGYGHDLKAARSPAAKQISDDLHELGIGLDEDTVRKYLQEGKLFIRGSETE